MALGSEVLRDESDEDAHGLLGVDFPAVDEVPQAELGIEDRPDPRAGRGVDLAVGAAGFSVTTSGRAVLVAGSTVAVALLGLYACGSPKSACSASPPALRGQCY